MKYSLEQIEKEFFYIEKFTFTFLFDNLIKKYVIYSRSAAQYYAILFIAFSNAVNATFQLYLMLQPGNINFMLLQCA